MLVLPKSLPHLRRRLLLLAPRLLVSLFVLTRLLRTLRPEAVSSTPTTLPTAVLAGRPAGGRAVCHVHEAEPDMPFVVNALLTAPLTLEQRPQAASSSRLAAVRCVEEESAAPADPGDRGRRPDLAGTVAAIGTWLPKAAAAHTRAVARRNRAAATGTETADATPSPNQAMAAGRSSASTATAASPTKAALSSTST
jgi:hypothetical protein